MRVRVSNGSANSRDGQRGAGSDRRSQAQHPVGANRDWLLERVATSRSVGWWPSWRNAEGRCSCRGAELQKSVLRSEEHTSELQSLMRISYAVFCLKKNIVDRVCIEK